MTVKSISRWRMLDGYQGLTRCGFKARLTKDESYPEVADYDDWNHGPISMDDPKPPSKFAYVILGIQSKTPDNRLVVDSVAVHRDYVRLDGQW